MKFYSFITELLERCEGRTSTLFTLLFTCMCDRFSHPFSYHHGLVFRSSWKSQKELHLSGFVNLRYFLRSRLRREILRVASHEQGFGRAPTHNSPSAEVLLRKRLRCWRKEVRLHVRSGWGVSGYRSLETRFYLTLTALKQRLDLQNFCLFLSQWISQEVRDLIVDTSFIISKSFILSVLLNTLMDFFLLTSIRKTVLRKSDRLVRPRQSFQRLICSFWTV